MGSNLIKEIPGKELRDYVKSSRACNFTNAGAALEAKFGLLDLEFDSVEGAERVALKLRRQGGNGKVAIVCGSNVVEQNVISNKSQFLSIELDKSFVSIKRPVKSSGVLEVLSVLVYSDKDIGIVEQKNWKSILSGCKYRNMKIVGNRLLASEGAKIESKGIDFIDTNPPNCARIDESGAQFVSSCEIFDIGISRIGGKKKSINIPHFDAPLDIGPPVETMDAEPKVIPSKINIKAPVKNPTPSSKGASVLFDSGKTGFSMEAVKTAGGASILNSKSIKIGHRGCISLPVSTIEANTPYIIIAEAVSSRGNGKMIAYIGEEAYKAAFGVANAMKRNVHFNVKSGAPPAQGSFRLFIERPQSSTGEIIITRIMLINAPATEEKTTQILRRTLPQNNINLNRSSRSLYTDDIADKTMAALKRYARFANDVNPPAKFGVSGTIDISTACGMSWFSKVKTFFPDIKHIQGGKPDLFIGRPGALRPAKNLLVEEFFGELSDEDIKHVKNANHVFTTSESNIMFLSKHNKNVEIISKVWPVITAQRVLPVNFKYVLVFNRSFKNTGIVVKSHIDGMPKFVVAGARGVLPPFCFLTNEYLNYSNLIDLIGRASCIVDLPQMNDYNSAVLNLAHNIGVPIVTTNWWGMHKDNVQYISSEVHKGIACPNPKELREAIEKALTQEKKPTALIANQNKLLHQTMAKLLKTQL